MAKTVANFKRAGDKTSPAPSSETFNENWKFRKKFFEKKSKTKKIRREKNEILVY